MKMEKPKIPVLLWTRTKVLADKQVQAWCPFCIKFHLHGFSEDMLKGKSHRVAHCFVDHSPFHERGYYLKMAK